MTRRLRTFIAVDPGEPVRDRLVALQDVLARSAQGVKWVGPENLHVTLLFLGEVGDRDVPALCQAVADVCAAQEAFALEVKGVGTFGPPNRPRTVWAGLGAGQAELVALHDALELPLMELGCYRREARRYEPHVTLGRAKGDGDNEMLATALTRHANWKGGEEEVSEVEVLSSELQPQGPLYVVLSRAKLSRAGRRKRAEEDE